MFSQLSLNCPAVLGVTRSDRTQGINICAVGAHIVDHCVIIEHVVKSMDRRSTVRHRSDVVTMHCSDTHSSNLDLCLISFLSPHPVFRHSLYNCTQSPSPSPTIVYMLLLLSSPHSSSVHPPSRTHTDTPAPTSPLDSRSDLWLLILYLSRRRTGAREMTCFCLG